jgi:hypothetical protein
MNYQVLNRPIEINIVEVYLKIFMAVGVWEMAQSV